MSYQYLNKLQLSAWITGPSGQKLQEYPFIEADEQTGKKKAGNRKDLKCWITSTEGANFAVNWQAEPEDESVPLVESKLLDLRCNVWLDGCRMEPGILGAAEIATGGHETLNGQSTDEGMRLYQFGTLTLTDDDNAFEAGKFLSSCIEVELEWGKSRELRGWVISSYTPPPEERELVHERNVKKGNYSSAALGTPTPGEGATEMVNCEFIPEPKAKKQRFYFYHASAEWLKARGVSSGPPEPPTDDRRCTRAQAKSQKRPSLEPEYIDVDELSDSEVKPKIEDSPLHDVVVYDDNITVYKHLAPVRASSSNTNKRLKLEEDEVKHELKEEVLD